MSITVEYCKQDRGNGDIAHYIYCHKDGIIVACININRTNELPFKRNIRFYNTLALNTNELQYILNIMTKKYNMW